MLILTGMEAAGPTLQGVLPLHLLSAKAQEIVTATSPSKGHPYKKANKNIHMLKTTPRHIIFYTPLETHFYYTIFSVAVQLDNLVGFAFLLDVIFHLVSFLFGPCGVGGVDRASSSDARGSGFESHSV